MKRMVLAANGIVQASLDELAEAEEAEAAEAAVPTERPSAQCGRAMDPLNLARHGVAVSTTKLLAWPRETDPRLH